MQDQQKKQRLLIIVGMGVTLAVVIVIALVIQRATQHQASANFSPVTTITTDPVSGQSFVTQKGVHPETQVSQQNAPTYAGFSTLPNYGVSADQITALQQALQTYQPFASNTIQISLAVNDIHIGSPDPNDPNYRWSISSHIVVNQKTSYNIKFYYWGTSTIQLYIYDSSGNVLFDSGTVGHTS